MSGELDGPELYLSSMTWADVAPAGHSLDLDAVRAVAEASIPALANQDFLRSAELDLHHELLAHFGYWIQGWRWTAGDSGGPVQAWSDHYSLLQDEGESPVERVVRAVQEWQNFLLEVRGAFDGEPDLEAAALRLLPIVVGYTETCDAWYDTFAVVLGWFLEFRGLDARIYRDEISRILGGRFRSWCAPEPHEAKEVCARLGRVVARVVPGKPVDALAIWREQRKIWSAHPIILREPRVVRDGHLAYLLEDDTRRARRMLAALIRAREWAVSGEPLGLSQLQEWNGLILGEDAILRTTPAFAKGGREVYGMPFLQDLQRALWELPRNESPLCYRAARAYLDVCFFHPFEDGNARTARMLLDAILWREGKALHRVEPAFHLSRPAAPGCLLDLSSTVNQMLSLRTCVPEVLAAEGED